MSVPAKVGTAVPLVMILEDGNEDQYPRAEIYAAGATSPLAIVNLSHKAKGRYEGSWTPTNVGTFSSHFFVYSDPAHTIENIVYVREIEQIFASESDVDDLAASIIRLLGLHRENIFIDNTTFDAFDQLVGCRIRLFNSKANAEAATDGGGETIGLVATYTMVAEHEGEGKMKTFRQVRDS